MATPSRQGPFQASDTPPQPRKLQHEQPMREEHACPTRKPQKNVRYGNTSANYKRSVLDKNATSTDYAPTVKRTSTARVKAEDAV